MWNFFGARAATQGLKLYTHKHDTAYSFLLDSGPLDAQGRPTRSSGLRRLEWFLQNTDPSVVYLEMDVYWAHVAQHRFQSYTAPDGTTVQDVFDPAGLVAERPTRLAAAAVHVRRGSGLSVGRTAVLMAYPKQDWRSNLRP